MKKKNNYNNNGFTAKINTTDEASTSWFSFPLLSSFVNFLLKISSHLSDLTQPVHFSFRLIPSKKVNPHPHLHLI